MFFEKNIAFLKRQRPQLGTNDFWEKLSSSGQFSPQQLLDICMLSGYSLQQLVHSDLSATNALAEGIKLVIFDVDGVLTDAGMYYTESGDEFKKFNARDGLAIKALPKLGYSTGIISHGKNIKLISNRASLLGITKVYCGNEPKDKVLLEWCNELNIVPKQVAYIGDDVNDLSIMALCGFTAAPGDAVERVKNKVHVVLQTAGGCGCVREWIDHYILPEPINENTYR
ncbi:MAG: KdsC family phosphatase [Bacteroidia bacterium]|jgi:3-deoxy-D-manno-octulosonate 8-phosphate phosphatase (KDO 8-P phosphatase)